MRKIAAWIIDPKTNADPAIRVFKSRGFALSALVLQSNWEITEVRNITDPITAAWAPDSAAIRNSGDKISKVILFNLEKSTSISVAANTPK
jgi:hypothetical protein